VTDSRPTDNKRPTTQASLASRSALTLAGFVALALLLLMLVYRANTSRIQASQRAILAARITEVLPAEPIDNQPLDDVLLVKHTLLGTTEAMPVYRAWQGDKPVAAALSIVAPDGYSGTIQLLIGISADGEVTGVRALKHRETPGIGDKIELSRSNWILGFNSQSLERLPASRWRTKRTGGHFDAMTGATITSSAVIAAVYDALLWFTQHKQLVFVRT